ncbi:MAG: hydroxymethylglutaryl-CoA lyase [Myxococcota bacterium]
MAVEEQISVYEVGLRDGLQNEKAVFATADKRQLLDALIGAGLRRIELTSFVSPRWVPQLADAETLATAVEVPDDVRLSALVPNAKGLERAMKSGLTEVAVFLSASETHNRKNINKSIARALDVFREIVPPALEAGLQVRAYVSTVWGCPYEGPVDPARVVDICRRLDELGCYQISLGDTIGVGTPNQTRAIVRRLLDVLHPAKLALHMHDTRGTALANVLAAIDLGVRDFDASIGGMGGCPYAPGASGNLATEDLVYMLEGMGFITGIDLERLIEAGEVAERIVGRRLPGKVHQAGPYRLRPA